VSPHGEDNRELVALAFQSLDAAFVAGGEEGAGTALREAFARRIHAWLRDLPSPEEMARLPEADRCGIRERQRRAARLRHKREAALRVIPQYSQLIARQRSYDAEIGSPWRIASHVTTSASTVLVGAALGYLVERILGLAHATMIGIALGTLAFLSLIGHGLQASRRMTAVETAHTAALERLKMELYAAFEAVDRRGEGDEDLET
jgi:F0F1-type ATP synthase assembly protein I